MTNMSEMGLENVFYLESELIYLCKGEEGWCCLDTLPGHSALSRRQINNISIQRDGFECAGDEVLVESSPPASPVMAAQLAQPTQGTSGSSSSPSAVRELIVIPEISNGINLQHAIQQVSTSAVEVNGDSSGHSSPNNEPQHTYIVAKRVKEEASEDDSAESLDECEGGNGVNYHVQYVEPQEIYTQGPQSHMETLRAYPVFGVANVETVGEGSADGEWTGEFSFTDSAGNSGNSGAGSSNEQPTSPAPPARMPPATVQWLLDHYETAEGVSLPRSTLYAHYLRHCTTHRLEPVNAASFGKLIRSVFVGLRTRRLGTRGNSKYHYYGIRAKPTAHRDSPTFPNKLDMDEQQEVRRDEQGAVGLIGSAHRQYLGAVLPPDPPDLFLEDLPDDVPSNAAHLLFHHHREHGIEFLEAVAALDTGAVERARRNFWKRPPGELCRRALYKLTARRDVAIWLRKAELQLHQRAVDLLLPDVLRPIPSQLTQAIRNFAKSLESALAGGGSGAPPLAQRAQASAAGALAGALRRYTSLNHLAQAARAVLTNQHQIQQMVSDLSRVDFRVVREQARWACACGSTPAAHKLEADFKATLGRGATLEQWASWLESCVRDALAPHTSRPDYTPRARRLLLDWSFYSSLVIRELTLRSAASFGSFHLIRLLYDEYVAFLVERRVAAHRSEPPIAVMQRALDDDDELPEEVLREEAGDGEFDGEGEWEWGEEEEDDEDELDGKRPRLSD